VHRAMDSVGAMLGPLIAFGILFLAPARFDAVFVVSTLFAILGFLTLPSALVGGLLAAYFTGGIITLGSLVGFLTVFGIAARNKIMLINHYQHLEKYEGEVFGPHLALRGALERLSPILMTALATGLALVPLVISGNIPGHEIEYPMAIVILGGMVTSTLLNLFVVPSLYLRFGRGTKESVTDETPRASMSRRSKTVAGTAGSRLPNTLSEIFLPSTVIFQSVISIASSSTSPCRSALHRNETSRCLTSRSSTPMALPTIFRCAPISERARRPNRSISRAASAPFSKLKWSIAHVQAFVVWLPYVRRVSTRR